MGRPDCDSGESPTGRPAVFVDRDGTVIEERDYLADPEGVELVHGAAGALERLDEAGFAVVVVTNQSGIARGLYTEEDYEAVARRLDELLAEAGVVVGTTLHCPHHPDVTGPCECRKPGTLLHRRAADALGLDLERSWYVGDKVSDVLPAVELGGRGILVQTGYGREERDRLPEEFEVAEDFRAAVDLILDRVPDPVRGE